MRDRPPNPKTSDAVIARTSFRGTLICRWSAVAPASRKSARVRAPISAGKTVAKRTRRFRTALAYLIPASIPCSFLGGRLDVSPRLYCLGLGATQHVPKPRRHHQVERSGKGLANTIRLAEPGKGCRPGGGSRHSCFRRGQAPRLFFPRPAATWNVPSGRTWRVISAQCSRTRHRLTARLVRR